MERHSNRDGARQSAEPLARTRVDTEESRSDIPRKSVYLTRFACLLSAFPFRSSSRASPAPRPAEPKKPGPRLAVSAGGEFEPQPGIRQRPRANTHGATKIDGLHSISPPRSRKGDFREPVEATGCAVSERRPRQPFAETGNTGQDHFIAGTLRAGLQITVGPFRSSVSPIRTCA
jgi:hypothetical protein